jgi:hypothetical protein
MVKGALPAGAKAGLSVAMVGPTAKFTDGEVVAPFATVMAANAVADANKVLGTVAVSWLALTKCVVKAVPPNDTTELLTKFAPLTVSVKVALPTRAEDGLSEEIVGPETLNVVPEEATLPFRTVTTWDGVALSTLPRIATVSFVELT